MKSRSIGAVLVIATYGTAACVLPDVQDLSGGGGATGSSAAVGSISSAATTASGTGVPSGTASGVITETPPPCLLAPEIALQFVNVAPSATVVDFCVGLVGEDLFPVAKVAGALDGGLPFGAFITYGRKKTSDIDVQVFEADKLCSGTGLTQRSRLSLMDLGCYNSISVYYVTDKNGTGTVVMTQNLLPDHNSFRLRFLNAVPSEPSLDFGLTDSASLPAAVNPTTALNVGFKLVPHAGPTSLYNASVDPVGYLEMSTGPKQFTPMGWGAALSMGTNAAVITTPYGDVESYLGHDFTFVATGIPGDPKYPLQFVQLDEQKIAVLPQATNPHVFDGP